MQICALWSHIRASTSTETTSNSSNNVLNNEPITHEDHKSMKSVKSICSRVQRPAQQKSAIYALICLLLIITKFGDAASIYEGGQNGLQNSLIYSSLLRSNSNANALNGAVVIVRKRRSSTVTPSEERELIAMTEKKSYPRICYFSPIQCLFSSSSGSLTKRRR